MIAYATGAHPLLLTRPTTWAVPCTQVTFRNPKATTTWSLEAVLRTLYVAGMWTTLGERDAYEERLRAGEAIETEHARYQVVTP